jgi:hypothetical protein
MSAQFDGEKPADVSREPTVVRRALTYLRADWLRVAILGLTAILIHLPALGGELIWDDNYLAQGNPFIKSPLLALEAFRHYLFLDSFSGHYRPVQNLSFMVDYAFWTDNPYGFHLTNILLHGAGGVLLYFLLRRILRPLFRAQLGDGAMSATAFLVALLWTVHPVHSAAVDYISGRADSLAFGFAAGGWLLFLRARAHQSAWLRILLYLLAAGVALLALCSRETAGIWLFLFVLHNLFFATGWSRRGKIALLLASVALFLTYVGLRQLPEHRFSPSADPGWSAPMRSVLILRALGDYGRLMVWPANLHMERTVVNPDNYKSFTSWQNSIGSEYLSILGLSVGGAADPRLLLARPWSADPNLWRDLVCLRVPARLESF